MTWILSDHGDPLQQTASRSPNRKNNPQKANKRRRTKSTNFISIRRFILWYKWSLEGMWRACTRGKGHPVNNIAGSLILIGTICGCFYNGLLGILLISIGILISYILFDRL